MAYIMIEGISEADVNGYYVKDNGIKYYSSDIKDYLGQLISIRAKIDSFNGSDTCYIKYPTINIITHW